MDPHADTLGFTDYCRVLDVSTTASQDEIMGAYRKLAHYWHPDRNTLSTATEVRHVSVLLTMCVLYNSELIIIIAYIAL